MLYLGVSEWTADQIQAALDLGGQVGLRSRIVSNQAQYNMLWRVIEPQVLPLCERQGIGHLVFQPLAQGVLTGKYRPGEQPPPGSRAASGGGPRGSSAGCSAIRCWNGCSNCVRSRKRPVCPWLSSRSRGHCTTAA